MSGIKDRIAEAAKTRAAESTTFCGEAVEVRAMSVGQRSHVMDVGYSKGPRPSVVYERFYPALITATVFEPGSDAPLFTDADRALINSLPPDEVDRVAEIALRLSGLDKDAAKGAEKNSDEASDD